MSNKDNKVIRIGLAGIPSSGKSSTSRGISSSIRINGKFPVLELITEYARTYISKFGSIENIWEQYKILDKQLELEEEIAPNTELLITDSPLQLAFQYSLDVCRKDNMKDTMVLDDIFHKLSNLNTPQRYDIIFHLPPAIEVVKDGIRPKHHVDPVWRTEADFNIRYICKTLFPPKKWIEVTPVALNERVEFCNMAIEKYVKEMAKKD